MLGIEPKDTVCGIWKRPQAVPREALKMLNEAFDSLAIHYPAGILRRMRSQLLFLQTTPF